jgi:hypothetical protein
LLFVRKRYLEAEEIALDCLRSWKLEHGNLHPGTQLSMERLAMLYDVLGRPDRADELASEAMILREERFRQHKYTSIFLMEHRKSLALHVAYRHSTDHEGKENLALRLWKMRDPTQKPQARDFWIVEMMEEIAKVYSQTCRTKDAVRIMKMALEWNKDFEGLECWRNRSEHHYSLVKARRREWIWHLTWEIVKSEIIAFAVLLIGLGIWWFCN